MALKGMVWDPPVDCWRKKWQPTPVPLPGKSHEQRSMVGYSPWGRKESNTTERLHFHFSLSVDCRSKRLCKFWPLPVTSALFPVPPNPFTQAQTCGHTVHHHTLRSGCILVSFLSTRTLEGKVARVISPLSNSTCHKYTMNINEWLKQMMNIAHHMLGLF